MEVFHGIAAHPGVAIASAAKLRDEFGAPMLDPARLRRLGKRLMSFGVEAPETEQVVLVAPTVLPGFLSTLIPGLEVVGTASAAAASGAFPAVSGLNEAFFAVVAEDDLLIVDGNRGRVYVAPDAATVARYQAPFTLARRIFMDSAHIPARTASDNRIVTVFAPTPTRKAVDDAMEAGADGIVIPEDNDFLGAQTLTQTAGEQLQILLEVAQTIGGQPIILDIPAERLALSALSRAAAAGPLHVPLADDESARDALAERMSWVEADLEERDMLFGTVAWDIRFEAAPPPETLDGWAGVFVPGDARATPLSRLHELAALARQANKPAALCLDGDWWPQFLSDALGLGFARLVVPIAAVLDVKDAIRAS